jgi:uncharacterized membrane protein YccF (DUF307 family)
MIWKKLKGWWMAFAHALGWVNTRVILTLMYIVIIGIPAIVLRIIRKDPLQRSYKDVRSYWMDKAPAAHTIEESRHQF